MGRLFTFPVNSPPNLVNTQLLFLNMSLADAPLREGRSLSLVWKKKVGAGLRCVLQLLCDVTLYFGSLCGKWEL